MVGIYERATQRRVVDFFRDELGYAYLGNWQGREGNTDIERELLTDWLRRRGHDEGIIAKTLRELERAAAVGGGRRLYEANRDVYDLLRYGVKVRPEVGENNITVWPIDWNDPDANDFAIAEEVTVRGQNDRRPDIALYVNGIALGVLELKRSTVSVSEGIRQSISSQRPDFIRPFYSTTQLLMAGNETEGLRYGVIGAPERKWLRWKEDSTHPQDGSSPLLRELWQLCRKERLLDITHDFITFDSGEKKIARHNQYFGVQAAQERLKGREGGIIWHTQGSGKSLTMVWLARWIRENITNSRVLVITDRTELDTQIEGVFKGVNENIHRVESGAGLLDALNDGGKWLIASLIHKFGSSDAADTDAYVNDIRRHGKGPVLANTEFFVFVDECHRTQSGKLHAAMKSLLPEATFIGFTGTPLLKADKPRSVETFGTYIHAYKYDEAVSDGVVLDLRYEARDIDQSLTSQARIDDWFEAKTRGLTETAKAALKSRWGTMQSLHSSRDRLQKIVDDILLDMATMDRLQSGEGNALLVCDSIYSACRVFEMFGQTELAGKCAVVTSYNPSPANIRSEDTGEGQTESLLQYQVYRRMLAEHFDEPEQTAMNKTDIFEHEVKERFVNEPARLKLLIVVDKLLTGFDAPSATYLYIDKSMHDHGLFQAICRVNRLHTEDKEYGFVIDYRDLFKSLQEAIIDYTGGAFSGYDADEVQGLLKDRLRQGKERLEDVREKIKALCEPVEPPRDTAAYIRYFCEDGERAARRRFALYRLTSSFVRAYATIANEMARAGYSAKETETIKGEVTHYESARQEVKLASGDYIDLKVYEPAMRHLLDTYIRAEESEKMSAFEDLNLVDMLAQSGRDAIDTLPESIRDSQGSTSETIENNIRRVIIDKSPVNPIYYANMSSVLDALVQKRRQQAIEYEEYLAQVVDIAKRVNGEAVGYPPRISTPELRALYDNLPEYSESTQTGEATAPYSTARAVGDKEEIALELDRAIREAVMDDWRGHVFKERNVRNSVQASLGNNGELVDTIFEVVKAQNGY